MHADLSEAAMSCLIGLVYGIHYDLCVLTGDYRGKTFGSFDAALQSVAKVTAQETNLWCARQPRHHQNGSSDGGHGHTRLLVRGRVS